MKQLVSNYTFNTSTKAITFTDFSTVRLDRLQLIVDTTTNKVLYNFADSTVTTASVSTNVVTLAALQGGENNTDKLQIVYDSSSGEPRYDGGQTTMANALPVAIASDQSAVLVKGTATGSAVPSTAQLLGVQGSSSNLQSVRSIGNAGTAASGTDFWMAVANAVYNGTNMDVLRGNSNTTTGDTGTKTTSFAGATQTNYNSKYALITVLCGTVSGTSPTLTAQLQWNPDGAGTTWLNLGPASTAITTTGNTITFIVGPANFAQTAGATPANLTTGATQTVSLDLPLPRTWRLNYTIGGTTPSFAITAVYVNYAGL